MMTSRSILAAMVACGFMTAAAPDALAQGKTGKKEVLVQSGASWNGKPYTAYPAGQPQLTVIRLTIAPHSVLPWHTHPFPNAGYVLSGTLTLHDKDSGRTQVFHAGQAFTESVDDAHRGESGDQPTVLILTYSGVAGTPTSVPLPGQPAEY